MLLESPLSHARIVLHDWRAAGVVHLLVMPRRLEELRVAACPRLRRTRCERCWRSCRRRAWRRRLARMEAVARWTVGSPLRSWEFHDLLFHARSRGGRHDQPVGGTYRFLGDIEPPPPLPELRSTESPIALYRPDLRRLEETDPPFARVQEARRSVREYGADPLTAQQLGEFLFRVGRVADYWEEELPRRWQRGALASAVRPYPAAGGLYELDLYPIVKRCDGLDPGLYCYDPERHALRPRSPSHRRHRCAPRRCGPGDRDSPRTNPGAHRHRCAVPARRVEVRVDCLQPRAQGRRCAVRHDVSGGDGDGSGAMRRRLRQCRSVRRAPPASTTTPQRRSASSFSAVAATGERIQLRRRSAPATATAKRPAAARLAITGPTYPSRCACRLVAASSNRF